MDKAIWKVHFTLDNLNGYIQDNTLSRHLGIQFSEKGLNYLKATMPVDRRTVQPMGILHGGASCVLAETVGSTASTMCVDPESGKHIVGIEINANHLRQVSQGIVTATATPVKIGPKMHVWSIEIHNEQNKLACVARLTTLVI